MFVGFTVMMKLPPTIRDFIINYTSYESLNATEIATENTTSVVTTTVEPDQKDPKATFNCPLFHGHCACNLYISSETNYFDGNIGGKYSATRIRFVTLVSIY